VAPLERLAKAVKSCAWVVTPVEVNVRPARVYVCPAVKPLAPVIVDTSATPATVAPSWIGTACADITTLGRMLISSLGTVVTLTGVAVAKFTALYWTGLLMFFL
jgi:hypothetical protein